MIQFESEFSPRITQETKLYAQANFNDFKYHTEEQTGRKYAVPNEYSLAEQNWIKKSKETRLGNEMGSD